MGTAGVEPAYEPHPMSHAPMPSGGKTKKTSRWCRSGIVPTYIPAIDTQGKGENLSVRMDTMGIEPKTGLITAVSAGRPVNGKPRHPKEKQKEVL
jgi:hypothetical protein